MGRKADFGEKHKRRRSRKSKIQPPPELPKSLKAERPPTRRALKRLKKTQAVKKEPARKAPNERKTREEEDEISPSPKAQSFSDDNKRWLKPKAPKKQLLESEDEDDALDSGREAFGESSDDDAAMDDEFDAQDGSDMDEDESDDEELPIEAASRKLQKKQEEDRKLAEEELKTNIAESEVFTLPSGQEIEKENAQPPDLAIISERIKDVTYVLNDFASRREPGRGCGRILLITRTAVPPK